MKEKMLAVTGRIKEAIGKVKIGRQSREDLGPNTPAKFSSPALVHLLAGAIIVLFVAEFAFAISIYGFKSKDNFTRMAANIIPYPAAFTTSGIVTVSQYWKEKDYIEHFYASTKQATLDNRELSDQILKQEVENRIISKEAIKFKIKVSKEDVDSAMEQIYDSNGGKEEVEKALVDLYGLSVSEFRDLVHTQLLRDQINKSAIEHVTVRHILIRVEEDASDEKIDEAKAKIDGYLNEIKAGLSFEEAAKKYSEDVGSNQEGGLLETFARGDMVKEFEDVAFSTPKGEISEPFRTSFGWHILQVEDITGQIKSSFEDWLNGLVEGNLVIYLYKD